MEIAKHLVFKGGTSLSKAWKLIHRFSEDIDLAIDKEFFEGYEGDISKSQIKKLRKVAGKYTTGTFFEDLKQEFESHGFSDLDFRIIEAQDSDQDPRVLEIYYPNVIKSSSEYILPRVQIEISCRSLREPFTVREFGSLVDEVYQDRGFSSPLFSVPTVDPERTLLEKLFLLHEEFHRPKDKMRVDRLSRHLYDIYQLYKADIVGSTFKDKKLYETIVSHRYKYARVGHVDYNLHNPKTLNPIPIDDVIKAWEADYARMKEDMIYEEVKPSFEALLENLAELKVKLQNVDWEFELSFPAPDVNN
ncbi:nucleotidyl transferase AbiEii/AbiGii toxin family protein [Membranihabitans maritimus]|uniref:nucleotidyl transferase AbiEii/AbiGii toxin family protein n=1 Tax=Membranihabitans maritimus TaxID=2904244 RepID=UPI001F1B83EB|nr:nucleotidyl transferase AbiEii/AbiGii toxin family protein [Membranihabitans maritimus]